jgi:hypothetical protein
MPELFRDGLHDPVVMSIDPATKEIVAAGRCMTDAVNNILPTGTYFGRRHADGTWETQLLPVPNDGVRVDGLMTTATAKDIEWDENGKPIVLLDHYMSGFGGGVRQAVWTAQPDAGGQWVCVERYFASLPADQAYGSYCGDLIPYAPGKFAGGVSERLFDKQNLHGDDWHHRTSMLKYDHGTWSVEYTGYDTAERPEHVYPPVSPQPGQVYAMFLDYDPLLSGVWWGKWQEGLGLGEPEQLPGTAGINVTQCIVRGTAVSNAGSMFVLYDDRPSNCKLVRVKPGGTADWFDFVANKPPAATSVPNPNGLHAISNGAAFFVEYGVTDGSATETGTAGEHWRWENENWIREEILPFNVHRDTGYCSSTTDNTNGQEYLIVDRYYVPAQDWPRLFNDPLLYFCTRVDPRMSP